MSLSFRAKFQPSIPIAIGYLSLGFAYGAILSAKGGKVWEAGITAILVFAGAAQFISLEMYTTESNFTFLFASILLLNSRHILYGIDYIKRTTSSQRGLYHFIALTDENYAILSQYNLKNLTKRDITSIFLLNHSYWVVGCLLGASTPSIYLYNLSGIEFVLTALFISIYVDKVKEKWKK